VTSPTSAGLYGPASASENADFLLSFADATSPINGQATVSQQTASYLMRDRTYLNVKSVEYPEGEVRGQVLLSWLDGAARLSTSLSGLQMWPNAVDTTAVGDGTFLFISGDERSLQYHVTHTVVGATSAALCGPALPGITAPYCRDLPSYVFCGSVCGVHAYLLCLIIFRLSERESDQ
jgi:CHRD domain